MTIFEQILAGEIPGKILLEREHCFALLDIFPQTPGHVLVIARKSYQYIEDTPDEVLADMSIAIKEMILRIKERLGVEAVNVVVNDGPLAGQMVPHIHFHIVPRREGDGLKLARKPLSYTDEELEAMAKLLS